MNVDPRVRLSLERTLLSWIRTSIALMGFGFLVARFSSNDMTKNQGISDFSLWIGVSLILIGVFVNLSANYSFSKNIKLLENGNSIQDGQWNMGKILSVLLSVLSLATVIHMILDN